MSQEETRCTDPKQGIKVFSYDLLETDERVELDAHMQECQTCRDLHAQVYGDEGAFRELEYRAFKLSQRQKVPASAWFAKRLQDLWLPFIALFILASLFGFWLVTRSPDVEPIKLLSLQALRGASLDTTSTVMVPRLDRGIESLVLVTDRDASLLVYETGEEALRRLIPGIGGEALQLGAREPREVPLPPVQDAAAQILLVFVHADVPVEPEDWDLALMHHFGGGDIDFTEAKREWPEKSTPTIRWLR